MEGAAESIGYRPARGTPHWTAARADAQGEAKGSMRCALKSTISLTYGSVLAKNGTKHDQASKEMGVDFDWGDGSA